MQNENAASTGLLRLAQVIQLTQLSRTTVDRLEQSGEFPQRFKLGPRAVAWKTADVLAWIDSRAHAINTKDQAEV